MDLEPERALQYARQIARPRRVGTSEHDRVANEVVAMLKGFGYRVERQSFRFSNALGVAISIELLVGMALTAGALVGRQAGQFVSVASSASLILLVLLVDRLNWSIAESALRLEGEGAGSQWARLCWRMGSRHTAANLIGTGADFTADPTSPMVILVAHYDSKSQRLPLLFRMALFTVVILGSLTTAILTLLSLVGSSLEALSTIAGVIVFAAGFPLLMSLGEGNDSPGAIDDASGVGTVLHLAELLAQRDDLQGDLRLVILLTSGEEMGVMGARAFVRGKARDLQRQARSGGLSVLNFDGVGVAGRLGIVESGLRPSRVSGQLSRWVERSCLALGLPYHRLPVLGAMFDHLPFAKRGFDSLTLSALGRASWSVHTPGDTPEQLDVLGFDQVGRVVLSVIQRLDDLQSG